MFPKMLRLRRTSDTLSGIYSSYLYLSSLLQVDRSHTYNMSTKERYEEVLKALNSLQSNAVTLSKIQPTSSCQSSNIDLINKYLERCGIDLDKLNGKVIHVSGTKGKGSTCALTESILRSHEYKTGFYSSPHLFSVTERIRINGKPLSQELFIKYFLEVYQTLYNNKDDEHDMPTYFKMITILAFKVFISEGVDVAVVEVGIGGEYDCTNALRQTSVVGVTSLGYDHLSVLGKTMQGIAWNKAGIMKKGCLAFTCSDQPTIALQVLRERAVEKQCNLFVIDRKVNLDWLKAPRKFIELNCALAVQLAHAWININKGLYYSSPSVLHENGLTLNQRTREGIGNCLWPGRFQIFTRDNISYYLDGAHTDESMAFCVQWFNQIAPLGEKRVLVFNLSGNRQAKSFLQKLLICNFDVACFCPNILSNVLLNDNKSVNNSNKCEEYANIWLDLSGQEGRIFSSVDETLTTVASLYPSPCHVLVTGSLHLVGNTTYFLQPKIWD